MDKEYTGLFNQTDDGDGDDEEFSRVPTSPFMDNFGWIYQASIVAEFERIRLEEVYELSTIQFLNDLSYLKSKAEFDKEQMKKIYGKKQ